MAWNCELSFGNYNTRRNLPDHVGRKRGEANFLGAFVRTVVDEHPTPCLYGRQFAIPSCGVADLVLCTVDGDPSWVRSTTDPVSIVAFETKLSDWRRALQQAYRYRYYADQAFVVLPLGRETRAVEDRALFRQLGIGLCIYDPRCEAITILCEPNPGRPLNPRRRQQALDLICRRARYLRKPHKHLEPLFQGRQVVSV
jgi:hypothetical protein